MNVLHELLQARLNDEADEPADGKKHAHQRQQFVHRPAVELRRVRVHQRQSQDGKGQVRQRFQCLHKKIGAVGQLKQQIDPK